MSNSQPMRVMLGAGGHAAVLLDILHRYRQSLSLLVAAASTEIREIFRDVPIVDDATFMQMYAPKAVVLINGVGMLPRSPLREQLYTAYRARGYRFDSVIAPDAIISPYAHLHDGVQILPGAIVQAGASIGQNSIVNTRAVIEHDCAIGDHNHVAPGAILCGGCVSGNHVFIGAGATVIHNLTLGEQAVIGAGAVVTKAIPARSVVYSYPPRLRASLQDM
ncbi:TPA: acetyltransferase [Citrobacter sedlakii]|nr:acetyltransferase [Citrobacter sedlakii]EKX8507935.1 acetyltransferase [Citrobacter sedlakii]HCA7077531.1 acetyltransferase [Citrobacter sedlakii]HCA7081556.1 acetyltransferase [Citrobacter sedlakii]HCA7134874.1 acetyltransferase [Citrobacter sedlakii]